MRIRKEFVIAFLFLVSGLELGRWSVVLAQGSTTIVSGMMTGTLPSTAVTAPTTGGALLAATDGNFADVNGVWVKLGVAAPAAGVSQITVCNMAGACGAAQTGPVVLNIPTKVLVNAPSVTATAPLGTLQ